LAGLNGNVEKKIRRLIRKTEFSISDKKSNHLVCTTEMNRLKNSMEISVVRPEVLEFSFSPETLVFLAEVLGPNALKWLSI
jgi:hypothetical protein